MSELSKKEAIIICSKCGAEMKKVYPDSKLRNTLENPTLKFMELAEFQCTNQECSYQKSLSPKEIVEGFIRKMMIEGKSAKDIQKMLKELKSSAIRESKRK